MTCRLVPSDRWKMKATNVYKLYALYILSVQVSLKSLWRKIGGYIDESKSEEHLGDIDEGNIGNIGTIDGRKSVLFH